MMVVSLVFGKANHVHQSVICQRTARRVGKPALATLDTHEALAPPEGATLLPSRPGSFKISTRIDVGRPEAKTGNTETMTRLTKTNPGRRMSADSNTSYLRLSAFIWRPELDYVHAHAARCALDAPYRRAHVEAVQIGHLELRDLFHLRLGDFTDLGLIRLGRALG